MAADSRDKRDGRFLEILGHYNPVDAAKKLVLKGDRIEYWISKGAQPSESVGRLLKRARREAAAAE